MHRIGTMSTGVALALLFVTSAAAQEGSDTLWSAGIPVWLMVMDEPDEAGLHRVLFAVSWDEYGSGLPFSDKIVEGALEVFLPKTEDADEDDLSDGCVFANSAMDHGFEKFVLGRRMDDKC